MRGWRLSVCKQFAGWPIAEAMPKRKNRVSEIQCGNRTDRQSHPDEEQMLKEVSYRLGRYVLASASWVTEARGQASTDARIASACFSAGAVIGLKKI